jgi:hypothetical protein
MHHITYTFSRIQESLSQHGRPQAVHKQAFPRRRMRGALYAHASIIYQHSLSRMNTIWEGDMLNRMHVAVIKYQGIQMLAMLMIWSKDLVESRTRPGPAKDVQFRRCP